MSNQLEKIKELIERRDYSTHGWEVIKQLQKQHEKGKIYSPRTHSHVAG